MLTFCSVGLFIRVFFSKLDANRHPTISVLDILSLLFLRFFSWREFTWCCRVFWSPNYRFSIILQCSLYSFISLSHWLQRKVFESSFLFHRCLVKWVGIRSNTIFCFLEPWKVLWACLVSKIKLTVKFAWIFIAKLADINKTVSERVIIKWGIKKLGEGRTQVCFKTKSIDQNYNVDSAIQEFLTL